jgi:hypothetical protein
VLVRLAELLPPDIKVCVVADRGFGDQKLLCGRPRKRQVLFACQNASCSAKGERRQSRPNPFGSSIAWSSST